MNGMNSFSQGDAEWHRDQNKDSAVLHWMRIVEERRKRIEQLEGALRKLLIANPSSVGCIDFHHPKKLQHEFDEDCPLVTRWNEAQTEASEALNAGRKYDTV